MNWTNKIKEDFGIEPKTRKSGNSTFKVVKEVLSETNENRTEALYKILSRLKENNVEITEEKYKQVNKLMSNLLTYVRKSYSNYEDYELIEDNNIFQIIKKN
jgi:hypothetical protein